MKKAWREEERRSEVREAVASWRGAKAIDDAAVSAAEALWPAAGPHLGWLWRLLLFVFVFGASHSFFAFVMFVLAEADAIEGRFAIGFVSLAWGIAMAVATEMILDRTRYAETGAAGACAAAAAIYLTAGPLILLVPDGAEWQLGRIIAAWAGVVLAGAALRWGMWPFAGGSAAALLIALATFPSGRVLWLVAGPVSAWLAHRVSGRGDLGRPYRWSAEAVFAVAVVATGLAVNVVSLDGGWLEHLELHRAWRQPAIAAADRATRILCGVATGTLPILLLALGIRGRRRVPLELAVLAAAGAVVTARAYWHIADLWLILAGAGSLIVLASLALVRWLGGGPEGERGGFTAEPLFTDRRREALLPIAAAIIASPGARTLPGKAIEGQGGSFGGGGAQSGF